LFCWELSVISRFFRGAGMISDGGAFVSTWQWGIPLLGVATCREQRRDEKSSDGRREFHGVTIP
jgi:hypothetical protein